MLFQRAFAKINLGLRVIRKREDGFHDLETVFHRVAIHDDVTAAPAPDLSLTCSDPALGTVENLVLSAAARLRESFGVMQGARLTLTKRIPYGAGLGGGSSDAAATLLLLCRLWDLNPSPGELSSIAMSIGSDVPYFLGNLSAHATSRGERLSWFPLVLPCAVLVVVPAIHVSTREAYRSVVPRERASADDLRSLITRHIGNPRLYRDRLENDFEETVFRRHPEIGAIRDRLYESGADFSLMSGSGSSVFALFADEGAARQAQGRFAADHRVFLTPPGFAPDLTIVSGRPD